MQDEDVMKRSFDGFKVFTNIPMLVLSSNPFPHLFRQDRSIGLTVDVEKKGADEFMQIILNHPADFMESLKKDLAPGTVAVGILVWEGNVEISKEDQVFFYGTSRRPTLMDMQEYLSIIEKIEKDSMKQTREHARHCHACAKNMGITPEDNDQAHEEISTPILFIPQVQGEVS